ncbi:MAG TPA: hypothetical protein VKB71_11915 [Rhizomicrobium sp.]|nr:hypothetical protein [Rhizomicrobium sp.]
MIRKRLFACLLVPLLGSLAGCLQNDRFADDAVQYNKEAEKTQARGILLNVLRASYRRPFLFSGVQTVTGSASAQAQIGVSIPFNENGGTAASTVTPQISRSAGPTVVVGVIDTQDFYKGLLTPIPPKLVDLYVQRGLPKMLLFDLFFSRIIVRQDGKVVATFSNAVGDRAEFEAFQTYLYGLVQTAKLTTESIDKPQVFGPLLSPMEFLDQPGYAAKLAAAGLDVREVSWCSISAADRAGVAQRLRHPLSEYRQNQLDALCRTLGNSPDDAAAKRGQAELQRLLAQSGLPLALYRAEKSGTDYGLCFAATGDPTTGCGVARKENPFRSSRASSLTMQNSSLCTTFKSAVRQRAQARSALPGETIDCTRPVDVAFVTRSTYGVIYYLGEIVRQYLRPDPWGSPPYLIQVPIEGVPAPVPLFQLDDVTDVDSVSAFLDVEYDGRTYAVRDDVHSQTNEVLDIVAELTALNKSAKDLPTSSVITSIAP